MANRVHFAMLLATLILLILQIGSIIHIPWVWVFSPIWIVYTITGISVEIFIYRNRRGYQ